MCVHFFRILFPGGGVDLGKSGYGNVGEIVFNLAVQVHVDVQELVL